MSTVVVFIAWLLILLILAVGVVSLFVSTTARQMNERNRRAGLGILALVSGPSIGGFLAWLTNTFGDENPKDFGYNYAVFLTIGSIAGIIAGIAFAVAGATTSGQTKAHKKSSSHHFDGMGWDD